MSRMSSTVEIIINKIIEKKFCLTNNIHREVHNNDKWFVICNILCKPHKHGVLT